MIRQQREKRERDKENENKVGRPMFFPNDAFGKGESSPPRVNLLLPTIRALMHNSLLSLSDQRCCQDSYRYGVLGHPLTKTSFCETLAIQQ